MHVGAPSLSSLISAAQSQLLALEEVLATSDLEVLDDPRPDDTQWIKAACDSFENLQSSKEQSAEKTALLKKINDVCYRYLKNQRKLDCCERFFGQAYFIQLELYSSKRWERYWDQELEEV